MTTIENLCNEALDVIGYKRHIGNIYEGTAAARIALNGWGNVRDTLLYKSEPDWARRDAPLVLLKQAPNIIGPFANYDVEPWTEAYPPMPWLYEYMVPDDAVKPLLVKRKPFTVPEFRPRYAPFLNRIRTGDQDTILCNITDAILVYVYRCADPDFWTSEFQAAMIMAMSKMFEAQLGTRPHPQRQENANAAG